MSLASPCQFHELGHGTSASASWPANESQRLAKVEQGEPRRRGMTPSSIGPNLRARRVLPRVTLSAGSAFGGRWNEEEG